MKVMVIPTVIGALGTVTVGLVQSLKDKWRPSKLLNYWDRPEYCEDPWRLEETCCHSNSSQLTSVWKTRKGVNNNNLIVRIVFFNISGESLSVFKVESTDSSHTVINLLKLRNGWTNPYLYVITIFLRSLHVQILNTRKGFQFQAFSCFSNCKANRHIKLILIVQPNYQ